MNIQNVNNTLGAKTPDNSPQATKTNLQTTTHAAPNSEDKVTLSSSVKGLEQQAKVSSVDNSVRIEELKQAIKDGSYQVDSEKVAMKLIETELLLAGA